MGSICIIQFATDTNTNFYPIFYYLPRTCGLSREAGFFAALLCIVVTIYMTDHKIKKTKFQKLLFFIAYIVSFSKMSIVLPLIFVILKHRKYINKISLLKAALLFIIIMGVFINYLNQSGFLKLLGGSIAHRFWGYGIIINQLTIKEFLVGNENGTAELSQEALNAIPMYRELEASNLTTFCGLPVLVIYAGYLGLLVFLIFMKSLNVKSSYFMILLIATIDVDLTTATSFVVLAYWFVVHNSQWSLRQYEI